MNKKKHLFIIAGEPSGDLHGAHLVKAMKDISHLHFSGVAGSAMHAEGVEIIMPVDKFAVMGFSDVLKALPALYKQFYILRNHILKTQPDGVLFIDYPGFNLRMARSLRRVGYKGKLIHYICPSVWAWGKKRIKHMAQTLDLLLTIYPFEAASFSHTSLKAKYVGNPLQEYISKHTYDENWKKQFNNDTLIGIFPGSRKGEIQRNLLKQLQAAALFQKKYPDVAFGISCADATLGEMIEKMILEHNVQKAFIVPHKNTYELMRDCHSAIAKSGTVTLELALHHRPTVVVYELSKLNRFIAKYLIRLKMPYYCIVNILSGKKIFPELIERGFNRENLAKQLEHIHLGPTRQECIKDCEEIAKMLQRNNASTQAAQAIQELLL